MKMKIELSVDPELCNSQRSWNGSWWTYCENATEAIILIWESLRLNAGRWENTRSNKFSSFKEIKIFKNATDPKSGLFPSEIYFDRILEYRVRSVGYLQFLSTLSLFSAWIIFLPPSHTILFLQFHELRFKRINSDVLFILLIIFHPIVFGKVNVIKCLTIFRALNNPSRPWGKFHRFNTPAIEAYNRFEFLRVIASVNSCEKWEVKNQYPGSVNVNRSFPSSYHSFLPKYQLSFRANKAYISCKNWIPSGFWNPHSLFRLRLGRAICPTLRHSSNTWFLWKMCSWDGWFWFLPHFPELPLFAILFWPLCYQFACTF